MKSGQNNYTETIHYIITFFCAVMAFGGFATFLFTGKPALIRFDSLPGHMLIGIFFILYACWFIYEDMTLKKISFREAVKFNFMKNATIMFIVLYWLILIIVPALFK